MTFYLIAMTSLLALGLAANLVEIGRGKADRDTLITILIQSIFVVWGLILLGGITE